ncbi:F-box protein [Hibiscus syriacus]|uniref:F-box protein n=1 Tax=Hibiscus syriacus TaxID=106335 RepID=A0A6A2XSD1_HIBSY|nr:F-box protein [Hibiscus syriacus]
MQHHVPLPLSSTPSTSPPSEPDLTSFQSLPLDPTVPDYASLLSDELLLNIFSKLPISQHVSDSLVCRRWLYLHGLLVQSLKVTDWSFVTSGRVFNRFPNLTDLDLVRSCIGMSKFSGIVANHKTVSVHVDTNSILDGFLEETALLPSNEVDKGLTMVAEKYPNLQRLVAIGTGEEGLLKIAEECPTLQELELHCCGDLALKAIFGIKNLQVVKLIGFIDVFYNSAISDIGLTLLAQGCRRLVKLELCGCEGSYDGVKAIGQCCQMLEELTLSEHRMDGGWLAGLSFCGNLKT